jgi:kinesin family protein 18/19
MKIRSALHSAIRKERLSLMTGTAASNAKRISSAGSVGSGHHRASASYSGAAGALHSASASSGVGRHRRLSNERGRRSPPRPISCASPPRYQVGEGSLLGLGSGGGLGGSGFGSGGRGVMVGQARRMGLGGGSPEVVRSGSGLGNNGGFGGDAGVGGKARRITIGTAGIAMLNGGGGNGNGNVNGAGVGVGGNANGAGGPMLRQRPSMVWR